MKLTSNITNLHTSTNQFQKGCMTYLLSGLVSIELYCIRNTQQQTVISTDAEIQLTDLVVSSYHCTFLQQKGRKYGKYINSQYIQGVAK